ncbi:hypothetical protein TNCV_982121 [Trichonephila clavipes]|nr:hypothetical protein TNCV_982121 [Trichonephila clavipes]
MCYAKVFLSQNDNALGDSKKVQAKRRLFLVGERLQANPELRDRYVKFMQDYCEHLRHMQLLGPEFRTFETIF